MIKKIENRKDLKSVCVEDLILIKNDVGKFIGSAENEGDYPRIKVMFIDKKELYGGSLEIRRYETDEEGRVTGKYSSQEIPGFSKRFGFEISEIEQYKQETMEEELARRMYA